MKKLSLIIISVVAAMFLFSGCDLLSFFDKDDGTTVEKTGDYVIVDHRKQDVLYAEHWATIKAGLNANQEYHVYNFTKANLIKDGDIIFVMESIDKKGDGGKIMSITVTSGDPATIEFPGDNGDCYLVFHSGANSGTASE